MKLPNMWSNDFWDILFNNEALELWCYDYILICSDDNINTDIKLRRWIVDERVINEIRLDDDNFLSFKDEDFGYYYETPDGKPIRN